MTAKFSESGQIYNDDPKLFSSNSTVSNSALMGDIVHLPNGQMELNIEVKCSAPIERIDIFNGLENLETVKPYKQDELGNRIRIIWEGAEYRGRFRQVIWDGSAYLSDNEVVSS